MHSIFRRFALKRLRKSFGRTAAVFCFLTVVAPTFAQIPPGLVSWWRGENNTLDSTNVNHGPAIGALRFTSGQLGQAFSFEGDGPGTSVGVVRIPNSSSLQSDSTNLSISMWVRSAAHPGTFRYLISKSRTSGSPSWALYTGAPTGTGGSVPSGTAGVGFFVTGTNASSAFTVVSPLADESKVWDGNWHFLVGTFNRTACRLYLDGLEIGSGAAPPATAGIVLTNNFQNGDLILGDFSATNFDTLHYSGALDEVMLFNRALISAEVANLYRTFETNLVAWWQAEGDAADSIGAHDGTIQGNVYVATGRSGKAFHFIKGVVTIPDDVALRPASLTVNAQVRAASPATNKVILSKSLNAAASSYAFTTGPNSGLTFTVSVGGSAISSPYASAAIWDGQYHSVFGTYDGAIARLFVDGFEIGAGTAANGAPDYSSAFQSGKLIFGDFLETAGAQNFSGGSIDEIRIFNRALSAAEITARTPAPLSAIVAKVNPSPPLAFSGSYVTFNVTTRQPIFINNNGNSLLPLRYQWSKDGFDLAGMTGSSLIFPSAQPNLAGQYDVRVFTPALSYIPDGRVGNAFRINSEIRIPNGGDLNFTSQVTVQLWARAALPPGTYRYLFSKSFSSSQSAIGLYTGNSGTAAFYIKYANANTATAISSQLTSAEQMLLWDGNWHQLTGVYSSSDGVARLYIDGNQLVSTNGTVASPGSTIFNATATPYLNGDIMIGDFSEYNGAFHFQGDLDEIKVINRALSANEIRFSYTNSTSTNFPGTVVWLRGENNLTDSASNHTALASPPQVAPIIVSATLGFQARFANASFADGNFRASVVDSEGSACVVQKSSDGRGWNSILTNTVPFHFSDVTEGNSHLMYRAVLLP